jgi:hypothetical protein
MTCVLHSKLLWVGNLRLLLGSLLLLVLLQVLLEVGKKE